MKTFAVIYRFEVKSGREGEFIRSWERMTELIKEYEGGLGSVLNKLDDQTYIAYAQWPDRKTWEMAGSKLPEVAAEIRLSMRQCCHEIDTLHELNIIKDLLLKV